MRAARYHDYGPADVLVIEDIPEPHAGPGEIRIQVTAASVNPVDWKLRSGKSAPTSRSTFRPSPVATPPVWWTRSARCHRRHRR